jgi:adenosylcobinamide-phosphate synthase
MDRSLLLLVGQILDAVVGEPDAVWKRVPHPVVIIGKMIERLDAAWNREGETDGVRKAWGVAALGVVMVSAMAVGAVIEGLGARLPFGELLVAIVVGVMLAQRSLHDHVLAVAEGLERGGLAGGRDAVRMIVGRDPNTLDEAGVARAAIESTAENLSDGVIAPAFWFLVAGLPGLLAYKALNTADSMIGHRTPRHEAFGWAAARLDDVANWPAARLCAGLTVAAAWSVGLAGAAAGCGQAPLGERGMARGGVRRGLGIAVGRPKTLRRIACGGCLDGGGPRGSQRGRYPAVPAPDGALLFRARRPDGTLGPDIERRRLSSSARLVRGLLVVFGRRPGAQPAEKPDADPPADQNTDLVGDEISEIGGAARRIGLRDLGHEPEQGDRQKDQSWAQPSGQQRDQNRGNRAEGQQMLKFVQTDIGPYRQRVAWRFKPEEGDHVQEQQSTDCPFHPAQGAPCTPFLPAFVLQAPIDRTPGGFQFPPFDIIGIGICFRPDRCERVSV